MLVARFLPSDAHHQQARALLDSMDEVALIPQAVVVEAWGILVGRNKRPDFGQELLAFVSTPGATILLPDDKLHPSQVGEVTGRFAVDFVDAVIVLLADSISDQCRLDPPMHVLTLDLKDINKIRNSDIYRFRLWHLESGDRW